MLPGAPVQRARGRQLAGREGRGGRQRDHEPRAWHLVTVRLEDRGAALRQGEGQESTSLLILPLSLSLSS